MGMVVKMGDKEIKGITSIEYKDMVKSFENQAITKPYCLMGARQYKKFRLNPKKYFKDLINSIWC